MSKIVENITELESLLKERTSVVVLFYASWCPYCRQFLPIYEKHSKGDDRFFCRVVIDEAPDCEMEYSIDVVPTVIFFENGRAIKRLNGTRGVGLREEELTALLNS